jgi:dolichol-phosphate mannosyltransferase
MRAAVTPTASSRAGFLTRILDSRLARFLVVGASGAIVNLGALAVLLEVFAVPVLSGKIVAIELSILWNFVLNDRFTFRDRRGEHGVVVRLLKYNLVALVGLVIQLGISSLTDDALVRVLGLGAVGHLRYLGQAVGIVAATAWNFLSNLLWTWRVRRREAAPLLSQS